MIKDISKRDTQQPAERSDKRIQVALPVRMTHRDGEDKSSLVVACTYDISPRGARIFGPRFVARTGDTVTVERGRNRFPCRVVWVGEPDSERRGQIGVQCVKPDKAMWESELRDLEDAYDEIVREPLPPMQAFFGRGQRDRRRHERFLIKSTVESVEPSSGMSQLLGELDDLSEFGCRVTSRYRLARSAELHFHLTLSNFTLAFKGEVRHSFELVAGIEFQEVRKAIARSCGTFCVKWRSGNWKHPSR